MSRLSNASSCNLNNRSTRVELGGPNRFEVSLVSRTEKIGHLISAGKKASIRLQATNRNLATTVRKSPRKQPTDEGQKGSEEVPEEDRGADEVSGLVQEATNSMFEECTTEEKENEACDIRGRRDGKSSKEVKNAFTVMKERKLDQKSKKQGQTKAVTAKGEKRKRQALITDVVGKQRKEASSPEK